jgi:hypothetical protein
MALQDGQHFILIHAKIETWNVTMAALKSWDIMNQIKYNKMTFPF